MFFLAFYSSFYSILNSLDFNLLLSDSESKLDSEELSELSEKLDKLELSISLSAFLAFFANSYRSMSSQATRAIFIGLCSPFLNFAFMRFVPLAGCYFRKVYTRFIHEI